MSDERTAGNEHVAEPPEFTRRALEEDYYPETIQRELRRLWHNPEEFEMGIGDVKIEAKRAGMPIEVYLALHLGICFGIEYERAYPTGRRDLWPVALDEREHADHAE